MRRASYFPPLFDGGDIAQPYRRAVLIRDDKLAVFVGRLHLIVSRKRHRPFGAIQTAFAELTLAPVIAVRTVSLVRPSAAIA